MNPVENNPNKELTIRDARADEFETVGQLMVDVYSGLTGFPTPVEQPEYYKVLANVGALTQKPGVRLLIAEMPDQPLVGAVVYFNDMKYYGSGGTATEEKNASGFRLLAVAPKARGLGIAKQLTHYCLELTRQDGNQQLIIHTTEAMKVAWAMYQKIGFKRSPDLDFIQGELPVYGFRFKVE